MRLLKHHVLTPVLDLIFPPVCVHCERVGSLLCVGCIATVAPAPLMPPHAVAPLADLRALGVFAGALQQAVHALKYEHLRDLAGTLGCLQAEAIQRANWPPSLILPVPLHEERQRERGYNQAALLGAAIAGRLGWPLDSQTLTRTRATRSQVGLGYQERQENVRGAFVVVGPQAVQGRDLVLVDDVYTTGATLRECAATLLAAGARGVRGMVVGQAVSGGPEP